MKDELVFKIPYPPSANRIWRQAYGTTYLSREYKYFKDAVAAVIASTFGSKFIVDHYDVEIELFATDARKRDVDNTVKPVLDAITRSGLIWSDDSLVESVRVSRGRNAAEPFAVVKIKEFVEDERSTPTSYGVDEKETKNRRRR